VGRVGVAALVGVERMRRRMREKVGGKGEEGMALEVLFCLFLWLRGCLYKGSNAL